MRNILTLDRTIMVSLSPLSSSQSKEIVAILGAWLSTSALHNNIDVFMKAGLFPVERNPVFYLDVQAQNGRSLPQWPGDGGEIRQVPLPQTP
jgi:hypothetical protein